MTHVQRIAVIGAGIAGNGAAWALSVGSRHHVTVFEAAARPGGHSATVDIVYDGVPLTVDTGFIVYNELNYPNLTRLFATLGAETRESDMSFSVSRWGAGVEWTSRASDVLGGWLPVPVRVPSPVHLRVMRDILRLNRAGSADLRAGRLANVSLGEYLARGRYSRRFRDDYLVAMGAAIWSMPPGAILDFPAEAFLSFFENHRLLRLSRPVWRTVVGGSRAYVRRLTDTFRGGLRLACPVVAVTPRSGGVNLRLADGSIEPFDAAILACHSDQALALIDAPTPAERSVLGAIRYRRNDVYLHRDASLMPPRRSAWAGWNVIKDAHDNVSVTYWMNALQGLDETRPLFVSLNPPRPPRPDLVFGRYDYAHPQFDQAALEAQTRLSVIQGERNLWFCGAWTGYGFHEDGLLSGLTVAQDLGASLPWGPTPRGFQEAAE